MGLEFDLQNPQFLKVGCGVLVNPELERQRHIDLSGSLASQSNLFGELLISNRPCLKRVDGI